MATKAEYLAALDARAVWVGTAEEDANVATKTSGALKLYNVGLLVALPNGTYQGQTQGFYVQNEGGAGEVVYPVNQERKNVSEFRSQLTAFLAGKISATLLKVTQDSVNEDEEFAVVTAYLLDTGTVSTKRYFVCKNEQGAAQFYEFAG